MATKKQKREALEAKRQKFLENERRIGLEALNRDRAERARQQRKAEAEARERNGRRNKKLINSIHKEV